MIHFDEQKRVNETILPGPFGRNTVVVTVEDDVHIDEEIKKNEQVGHGVHGVHATSSSPPGADEGASSGIVDVAATPPAPEHHDHHHHHHLQNKP